MFEKLDPSNPECGVRQVDVEKWIDADKRIAVSLTRADEYLINAVVNPYSKSKIIDNESSNEEIAAEKICWAKAADAYSALNDFCQKPVMLLGTGRNVATYFAFHFSVKTKRMHQASRHSPGGPESLQVPHGSPVLSRGTAVMRPGGV